MKEESNNFLRKSEDLPSSLFYKVAFQSNRSMLSSKILIETVGNEHQEV